MLTNKLMGGSAGEKIYIEDLFAVHLYTGNGGAQTINNGIDLAGKGGMVWTQARSGAYADSGYNLIQDTARGYSKWLITTSTTFEGGNVSMITGFNSSGYTLGNQVYVNGSSTNYASWTFRKQAKFFDVVTYTGDGSDRTIAHSLGTAPGMIIVKRTDAASSWRVYHRSLSLPNESWMHLNAADASFTSGGTNIWAATSTSFQASTYLGLSTSGATYVAYLFAHDAGGFGDDGTENVIQCGSYTGNGSTNGPEINLGWEPQYVLIKNTNGANSWFILDSMRGMPVGSADACLQANVDAAEFAFDLIHPTATGFKITAADASVNNAGSTYIYMAIRRGPMRTPTSGTSVFSISAGSVSTAPAYVSTHIVDQSWNKIRNATSNWFVQSRLTGTEYLHSNLPDPAGSDSSRSWDYMAGWGKSQGTNAQAYSWNFRRAPGFFDVVCYNGASSAQTIPHNLGVAPELIFVKNRTWGVYWAVYSATIGPTKFLQLNSAGGPAIDPVWNNTAPTSSVFSVREYSETGGSSDKYVAYLFASCPGVSKVGSYTGTGTTKQIDCGFTAGARFVLIKRTDSTGGWYTWDSARGIVSGNDPYLLMNSTAAEVTTTDYIDPYAAGFEISSTAPAEINASGGTFIYLAIA